MKKIKQIRLNEDIIFAANSLVLLAGPCVLEEPERSFKIGGDIKQIASNLKVPFVYKASFDKANRSSINSYRGPGLTEGLEILKWIKEELDVPVLTDIHEPGQADKVAEVADIIQIPAFLSRQTDLLVAAGRTNKIINIKKGQFMAPWDMIRVADKVASTGNKRILFTERGVSFGYNNLLVDMTSLPKMREIGYPVIFDATHSVQRPAAQGEVSGGDREMVPYLARAAVAVGIDALFMEVHDNPEEALSDGPNMVYLDDLEDILQQVQAINRIVKDR